MDPLNDGNLTFGGRLAGLRRTNNLNGPVPPPPPPPPPPSTSTSPWVGADGTRMYPGMTFCPGIPRYPIVRFVPDFEMAEMIEVSGTLEAKLPDGTKMPLNHQLHCAHCLQLWTIHPLQDRTLTPAVKIGACPFPCGYCLQPHPEKLCPKVYASRKKLADIYPWPNNVHMPAHIRLRPTAEEQQHLVQHGFLAINDAGIPQFTQLVDSVYTAEHNLFQQTVFGQAGYEAARLAEYAQQHGRAHHRDSRAVQMNHAGVGRGRGRGQPFGAYHGYQSHQSMGYQDIGYQNMTYPNMGSQNTAYSNMAYPIMSSQNMGYQNMGYQNMGYQHVGYPNIGTTGPPTPMNQIQNMMSNPFNPPMNAQTSQFGQVAFGHARNGPTAPGVQAVRDTAPGAPGPANNPPANPLAVSLAQVNPGVTSLPAISRRDRDEYNDKVRKAKAAGEEGSQSGASTPRTPTKAKNSDPLVNRMTFPERNRSFVDSVRRALPQNGGRRRAKHNQQKRDLNERRQNDAGGHNP